MTGYSNNNNLNFEFIGSPKSHAAQTNTRISRSTRRNAESVGRVCNTSVLWRQRDTVEVGDGHSSALQDGEDNITFPEQRTVSLNEFLKE